MNDSKLLICHVCGENEFTTKEGFYYCNECGTQTQVIRDVVYENNDTGEFGSQYLSRLKIQSLKTEKPELTSWECFNYLLRGLVEELLELGAKEELKIVTLQLWAHYLRISEAAFFNKTQSELPKLGPRYSLRDAKILYNQSRSVRENKRKKRSVELGKREIQSQKRKFMQSEYEKLSLSEQNSSTLYSSSSRTSSISLATTSRAIRLTFTRSARRYYKKKMQVSHLQKHEMDQQLNCHSLHKTPKLSMNSSNARLTRQTIYTILYLALNLTQDDIQLSDMLRFMHEGYLSSTQIMHFFPDEIALNSEELIKSKIFYSRRDIFLDVSIRRHTAFLCRLMHIQELKVPNLNNLINRYVYDLNLPGDIAIFINRLIKLCPIQRIPLKLEHHISPFYEARAMAFIIFTLKLLFGLDDKKEILISDSAKKLNEEIERNNYEIKKIFVWSDWVKFIEMRTIILSQCHLPTAIRMNQIMNQDQYLKQFTITDNLDDVTKLSTNRKMKLHNIHSIFESFQEKNHTVKTETSLKKFPPTLTPNRSYLSEILKIKPANVHIPEFMYTDHSQYNINCFVKVKHLASYFTSKNVQLKINELSCKSERNYIGVFRNLLEERKYRDIIARKIDYDIDEDEWIENITKIPEKSIILEYSQRKASSKPIQLKKEFKEKLISETNPISENLNSREHIEQASVKSIDVFSEQNMNPLNDELLRQPRRNLDIENIFADISDDEIANQNDYENEYEKTIEFNMSNFDYWIIFGKCNYLSDFDQVKNQFPKSYLWIIETCSNLLGIDWNYLFREIMIIENYFVNVLESFENVTNVVRFQTECKSKDLEKVAQDYKNLW